MSGFDTISKMTIALIETHPNPATVIQGLLRKSSDKLEQDEIKAIAWAWGIELDE